MQLFEEKAISIIKDNNLDEFNRGLIFLLYKTYLRHLKKEESKQKIDVLTSEIDSYPPFIQASIQNLRTSIANE